MTRVDKAKIKRQEFFPPQEEKINVKKEKMRDGNIPKMQDRTLAKCSRFSFGTANYSISDD